MQQVSRERQHKVSQLGITKLPRRGTQRTEGGERMWRDSKTLPQTHTYVCNKPVEASQNGHGRGTQQDNLHNAPGNSHLHGV